MLRFLPLVLSLLGDSCERSTRRLPMSRDLGARRRNLQAGTKARTGCATCRSVSKSHLPSLHLHPNTKSLAEQSIQQGLRSLINRIRKIKCDETKPFCKKCVDTGRTCEGYESPFRIFTTQPIKSARPGGVKSSVDLQLVQPVSTEVAPLDIELLNRYFSTKTIFDVDLGCNEEARQVLQASLTEPPIRHAVLSLKALREGLETSGEVPSGDVPVAKARQTPGHDYGLKQYCTALGGLASILSSPGPNGLKSVLLCCQLFISIEQVRRNYAAMAQHIVRGLGIMREYRARPTLVARNHLVPARRDQLPLLDVFIIKLFAAPCKFTDPPTTAGTGVMTTASTCQISLYHQPTESRDLRTLAPDRRSELVKIASSTLVFLGKVSQVESVGHALRLLPEKTVLLDSLESWLIHSELVLTKARPPGTELISVSFMRCFHLILKIVLLGALDSSPDLQAELQTESDRLQGIASNLVERVKAYKFSAFQGRKRTSPPGVRV